MVLFKKKEWLIRILKKFNSPIFKSKPKAQKYGEFLSNWSNNFNNWFPVFVGLLATIFITILTKDVNVPPQELFSYILTSVFTIVVLQSLLISIIVAGILYVFIIFVFGSLAYLLQKITYYIQIKLRSIAILSLVIILTFLGFYITRIEKAVNWPWMIGLLIESIGVMMALFIISHYLKLLDKGKDINLKR